MRATDAAAVPCGDQIALTLYDRRGGWSMCAVLDPATAERLAAALEIAAEDARAQAEQAAAQAAQAAVLELELAPP